MIKGTYTASKVVTDALKELEAAAAAKGYDIVRVEIHANSQFSAQLYTQLGTMTYPWSRVELPQSVKLIGENRFEVIQQPKTKEK